MLDGAKLSADGAFDEDRHEVLHWRPRPAAELGADTVLDDLPRDVEPISELHAQPIDLEIVANSSCVVAHGPPQAFDESPTVTVLRGPLQ